MIAMPEIAAAAIAAITPLLPYLEKAGTIVAKSFTEAIAKSGGEATWKAGEQVWKKLVGASKEDAKLGGAINLLSADPADHDSVAMLKKALEAHLERNPEFAKALLQELGGENRVQEMIAEGGSRMSGNEQQMGGSGRQSMTARDDSVIENSRQSMRK